ncbi:hypothetical protein M405DRAFT_855571 [Rhizopogon salebrosus TDB-379]|nr:hypothetical protein M405DRAFT_855571 [Rhizopogon salebrosus TDB-379]
MLPSWLSTKSSNLQAHNQPDDTSKDSHSTLEPTGVSSHSAVRITDDDHSAVHGHNFDPSTHVGPIAQDAHEADPFATSDDMKPLERSSEPASAGRFPTPHDDILADLQRRLPSSAPPEQQFLRPDAPMGSSLNLGSSAVETSLFTAESLPSHEPAKETMYDPSTGQRLHDYVPTPARSGADEKLWSHLSHILELQSEIAKMHVDMENVGRGHDGPASSECGANADTARSETGKHRKRNETLGEHENEDETDEATEGDESDGDDVFGKRKREEEFTRLAERFAKRKVVIDSVMDKLDNLSNALKAFHALPTPELDLGSSRIEIMSSHAPATTNRGTAGSSVVTSTTSAPAHLSIKPLMTTIMDDSQRVDSPLDMHPTQSIIDRNLGMR